MSTTKSVRVWRRRDRRAAKAFSPLRIKRHTRVSLPWSRSGFAARRHGRASKNQRQERPSRKEAMDPTYGFVVDMIILKFQIFRLISVGYI